MGAVDYAACYAVDASLDLLTSVVHPQSRRMFLRSRAACAQGWQNSGSRCRAAPSVRRPLTSLRSGGSDEGGHGFTTDPLLARLSEHLSANGVVHTIRRGMLRFAFHLFNSDDDVDRVLALTRESFTAARSEVTATLEPTTQEGFA